MTQYLSAFALGFLLLAQNPLGPKGTGFHGTSGGGGGGGTFAVVNSVSQASCVGGPTVCTQSISSTAAGDTELVFLFTGLTDGTLTDSASDTYTNVYADSSRGFILANSGALPSGVTSVTFSSPSNYVVVNMVLAEVSGLLNSSVTDASQPFVFTGYVATGTTPAVTTTHANDVVFGVVLGASSDAFTSSDCTLLNSVGTAYVFWKQAGATGSYSCNFTNTSGSDGIYVATFAYRTQ